MGNLRTAAVHDDRVQTHLTQKDHVFGEALLQMVIDHGIAAVFDDDTLAGELLQPWQRFNKHFCLLIGAQIGVHVEMEPRSLQFCRQFFSFLRRRRRYRCRLLQTAHWAVCVICDAGDAIAAGCYKQPTGLFVSFRSRR